MSEMRNSNLKIAEVVMDSPSWKDRERVAQVGFLEVFLGLIFGHILAIAMF